VEDLRMKMSGGLMSGGFEDKDEWMI